MNTNATSFIEEPEYCETTLIESVTTSLMSSVIVVSS